MPIMAQPISSPNNISLSLSYLYLNEKKTIVARALAEYFKDKDEEVKQYFVSCTFPSLFNQFSSSDYTKAAYKFIECYMNVFKGSGSLLTPSELVGSFILQSYVFQENFNNSFFFKLSQLPVLEGSEPNPAQIKELANILFQSFRDSLRFLSKHQIKAFRLMVNMSKEETSIMIMEHIFKPIISLWFYTPEFSFNKYIFQYSVARGEDQKYTFDGISIKFAFQKFLNGLSYQTHRELFDSVFGCIENSSFSESFYLCDIFSTDKICFSYLDVWLYDEILHSAKDSGITNFPMRKAICQPEFTDFDNAFTFFNINFAFKATTKPTSSKSLTQLAENNVTYQTLENVDNETQQLYLKRWEIIKNQSITKGIHPLAQLQNYDEQFQLFAHEAYKNDLESASKSIESLSTRIVSARPIKESIQCVTDVFSKVLIFYAKVRPVSVEGTLIKVPKEYKNNVPLIFSMVLNLLFVEQLKNYGSARIKMMISDNNLFEERNGEKLFFKKLESENFSPDTNDRVMRYLNVVIKSANEIMGSETFVANNNLIDEFTFFFDNFDKFEFGQVINFMNEQLIEIALKNFFEVKMFHPTDAQRKLLQQFKFLDKATVQPKSLLSNYASIFNEMKFKSEPNLYYTGTILLAFEKISKYINEIAKILKKKCPNEKDIGKIFVTSLMEGKAKEVCYCSFIKVARMAKRFHLQYHLKMPHELSENILSAFDLFDYPLDVSS
ncbi:hypothetical protein GPJ56_004478 [Histomonas meleagridis]|uniref:uncharacterized protein n=1 Tax=Histomonas meleagridis TaxID=135588 RepID=UPI00355A6A10|nr:hypothetical protein GPJ56_004478 [Histomonas meleagridis]KAH0801994.1 hypothetical protein GO595_005075 [Histomonas meleagridis]